MAGGPVWRLGRMREESHASVGARSRVRRLGAEHKAVRGSGDSVEVVLIDQADGFVFGFSKLDVMFGRTVADNVHHPYRDLVKPGVRFVQTTIRSIDPAARSVDTDAGPFDGDVMVVALGADLDPGATPGLVEAGHEFYTVAGAFALLA
jgi:sulfide:quinone oxidoreductase